MTYAPPRCLEFKRMRSMLFLAPIFCVHTHSFCVVAPRPNLNARAGSVDACSWHLFFACARSFCELLCCRAAVPKWNLGHTYRTYPMYVCT